jgi:hypothetical protein
VTDRVTHGLYEPMSWRGRLLLPIGLAFAAASIFFGLQWWNDRWHEAPIRGLNPARVASEDGRLLHLDAGRCNAALRVAVEETATQVRVLIEQRHGSPDDCGNGLIAGLWAPLGDREVVDRSTESVVPVRRP